MGSFFLVSLEGGSPWSMTRAERRRLGGGWLKSTKNNDINIHGSEEHFQAAFRRKERERGQAVLWKVVKHADSFVAESDPRLALFIMNYTVVIYLYRAFKELARLMKNA